MSDKELMDYAPRVNVNTSISTVLGLNLSLPEWLDYCPMWNDRNLGGFFGSKEHLLALEEGLSLSGYLKRGEIDLSLKEVTEPKCSAEFLGAPIPDANDLFEVTKVTGVKVKLKTSESDYGRSSILIREADVGYYEVRLDPGLSVHSDQLLINAKTVLGILYPGHFSSGTIYSAWREIHKVIRNGGSGAKFGSVSFNPEWRIFGDLSNALLVALAVNQARLSVDIENIPDRKLRSLSGRLNKIAEEVEKNIPELRDEIVTMMNTIGDRLEKIGGNHNLEDWQRLSFSRRTLLEGDWSMQGYLAEELRIIASKFDPEYMGKLREDFSGYLNFGLLYTQAGFEKAGQNRLLRLRGAQTSSGKYLGSKL